MAQFKLKINGMDRIIEVDENKPLLWVLRDDLELTGTKFGCGKAQCGACTVHFNGTPVRSCSVLVMNVGDADINTIEGVVNQETKSLFEAWEELNVPQCGYCQVGQIMSATALLRNNNNPTDEDINQAMSGNICRCGTYTRIREAIKVAARKK